MKNCSTRVRCRTRRAGFTLIELLTVIAIIAILASISLAGIARYLERAKETNTEANLKTIVDAMSEYSARTDNTTGFPAGYGFLKPEARETPVGSLTDADYVLEPYTFLIGLQDEEGTRQLNRYLRSYDTNSDGNIGLMEYLPIGSKDAASSSYTFSPELYTGSNMPMSGGINEVQAQLDNERRRPYVYAPFNSRQLQTIKRYWVTNDDQFGESLDMTDPTLDGRLFFPPPNYDGFVLIGNGPGGDDGGVVAEPPAPVGGGYDSAYAYHVAALRIAFLATRDWDPDGAGPLEADGKLDFEYNARKTVDTAFATPNGQTGYGVFIKAVQ